MSANTIQGKFEVIDSFAIARKNELYLIGNLIEGRVQENWYANISLNKSMAISVRIIGVEDIQIASDPNFYKLLILIDEDRFFFGLNIGSEYVEITIEGED